MILGIFDMFPVFLELTLRRQKTLFLYFNVSGTQTSTKSPGNLRASIFGRKKDYGKRKQANGDPRAKRAWPTRPRNLAAWAHPKSSSDFLLCASLAPTLRSFQKLMLVNFQVIWTSFGSLKHQNIEKGVFWQRKVNSRKKGKLLIIPKTQYKSWI